MKNLVLIIFGVLFSSVLFCQTKTQIVSNSIISIKTYEQLFNKGIDNEFITEEVHYDAEGRIIELKEVSRKGDIKLWEKYKFDTKGNLIEELTLDFEGKIAKKIVTTYNNNLRTSKEYFDSKGRLYKKKTYEYGYRK